VCPDNPVFPGQFLQEEERATDIHGLENSVAGGYPVMT
jgi:hypothetical protein